MNWRAFWTTFQPELHMLTRWKPNAIDTQARHMLLILRLMSLIFADVSYFQTLIISRKKTKRYVFTFPIQPIAICKISDFKC
jgi:hypothetical protein